MKLIIVFILALIFSFQIFSQWLVQTSGTSSNLKSVFFFNAQTGYVTGAGGLILITTNGGTNWTQQVTGISDEINSVYFTNFLTGYACCNSGKILYTSNSGTNWISVSTGVTDDLYSVNGSFCSGSGNTVLYTINGGLNWIICSNGFLTSFYGIYQVAAGMAFACGVNTIFQPLVRKTTNNGVSWTSYVFYLNGNEGNLRDIHFINSSTGFAVSNVWNGQGGISATTNGAVNWTTQLYTRALNSIDFAGSTGYSAGFMGYILRSTNSGLVWSEQSSGVSTVLRGIDVIDSLVAYAVGDGGVILKTTNGGITAIEPVNSQVPSRFSLAQNFPNPFNPSTSIRFDVAESGIVKLKIYNILGTEISVLVNENLNPGTYEINWDASSYPSGIYYYRLISGSFIETRKMILIK